MNYLLAYLRMASYSIVFLSSLYALKYGVRSVKLLFWGNIFFALCAFLSVSGFALDILPLQISINWFITTGATIWAVMTFLNVVRVK